MSERKILQAWEHYDAHFTPETTDLSIAQVRQRLGAVFCPGPYYFYVFDFSTKVFDLVSNEVESMLGVSVDEFNLPTFLSRIHPDDMMFVSQCEMTAGQFLFQEIPTGDMLKYKVTYAARVKFADGNYRMILHQAMGLTMDECGRLGKVLAVHSDISHMNPGNPYTMSFLGIAGTESRVGVDPRSNGKIGKKSLLTDRETEVLRLLAEGLSAPNIARELDLAEPTIRKHRENILKKTKTKNTAHLIAFAVRNGII